MALQKAKSPWKGAQLKLKPTTNEQGLIPALLVDRMEQALGRVEQVLGHLGDIQTNREIIMAKYKFRLLHGTHIVTDDQQRLTTYRAGDGQILESDIDLRAIHNRETKPLSAPLERFELVSEEQ